MIRGLSTKMQPYQSEKVSLCHSLRTGPAQKESKNGFSTPSPPLAGLLKKGQKTSGQER